MWRCGPDAFDTTPGVIGRIGEAWHPDVIRRTNCGSKSTVQIRHRVVGWAAVTRNSLDPTTPQTNAAPEVNAIVAANHTPHTIRRVAFGVGFVFAVLVGLLVWGRPTSGPEVSPVIGRPAPALEGITLSGGRFDIADHRGQWVVINLFATWCVPCQVEHPELVAFDEQHRATGEVQLVSVVFGDSDDEVRAFFADRGGSWPVLGEAHSPIIVDFGATGVPETFLVTPSGIVVERILGGVTQAELNDLLDAYR